MSDVTQRLQDSLAGRYRIERTLGRGGMATVFLADDLKHRRRVALKVLDPDVAAAIGPERFLREIETVAGLTHPHILPLFDSGAADGLLFYVMPFVAGESLRDRLARDRQLPLDEAIRITREIADALGYAHGHGLVHRDIKPENILLEEGHAVVADFGIARVVSAAGDTMLTTTGAVLGTPSYMSPEQAAGSVNLDGRSDVYSLACVLYEMLAGQTPFTGPTAQGILAQHLNTAPPRVTVLRSAVPASLEHAITRAMAKAPADRHATAAAFAAALTADAESAPAIRRRRAWPVALGATAVLLILVAVATWRLWGSFAGRTAAPPAKKDWILVAEFDGPPGDSMLAPAVRSLVSAALDQSQVVATVPRDQIRQALKSAGKPGNTRVDPEVARELAYRSAVRAVLEGTIGKLGKGYSIVLRVVDADTSRVILTQSGIAKDDDDLIPAIGELAKQLRDGLGENAQALRATRPMRLIATPSFEAYRLFVQTRGYGRELSNREALRLHRAALALDPDFATAWGAAAAMYGNLGYPDSARLCLQEALRRPERLSDRQIRGMEAQLAAAEGRVEDALAAYDRILEVDPTALSALGNSSDLLLCVGRMDEALARTRRAIELSPFGPSEVLRLNEAWDLQLLGRFDEAREANRRQTGIWRTLQGADIELGAGRFAAAESIATTKPVGAQLSADLPDALHWEVAAARFGRGSVKASASKLAEIDELYRRVSDRRNESRYRRSWIEFSVVSDGLLPLPPDPADRDTSGTGLLTRGLWAGARGDAALARRCLRAVRALPVHDRLNDSAAPTVLEARIEMLAGRPQEAVRLLRAIPGNRLGLGVSLTCMSWWLADAFEQVAQPDSAAFYLERVFTGSYFSMDGVEKPFAHHRLAQIYARLGRLPEAERHLAAVVQAWDRPDPEVLLRLDETRAAVRTVRGMAAPETQRR